jgi:hypothetical protein
LEPGRHIVVFRYAPVSFQVGAWITLSSALALSVLCVFASVRKRQT